MPPRSLRRRSKAGERVMPRETISDVVVMHAHRPMRLLLKMALMDDGYTVTEASTYTAVLRHLRAATAPVVVVSGNLAADYLAEVDFFERIAADATLARRHRYVVLCTIPEYLPDGLDTMLRGLGATVLRQPVHLDELLDAVGVAAGRIGSEDEPTG